MSRKDIIEAQSEDEWCNAMKQYLIRGELTNNDEINRVLFLLEIDHFIHEDVLFRVYINRGLQYAIQPLVVIPKTLIQTVLEMYHLGTLANHPGPSKMIDKIRRKFIWKKMYHDITNYCKSCQKCNETKRMTRPIRPPLILRDPAPRPWAIAAMDAIENLPITPRKHKHIIVVVDFYSKYLICFPTVDLKAETLVREFYAKVTCRVQGIGELQTDNGTLFASKDFQDFCARSCTRNTYSTALHPQSNGMVERMNRTILTSLRNVVNAQQNDWDEHLPTVEAVINSTPAFATGHSPYLLLHGCQPINPLENAIKNPLEDPDTVQGTFAQILQFQANVQNQALKTILKNQEKMKEQYDKKVHDKVLQPGDRVFLFWPRVVQKGPHKIKLKLAGTYQGEYAILRFVTPGTVTLKDLNTNKILAKPITIQRLKLATVPKQATKHWPPIFGPFLDPAELEVGDFPANAFEPVDPDSTQEEEDPLSREPSPESEEAGHSQEDVDPNREPTPEPVSQQTQNKQGDLDLESLYSQEDAPEADVPPGESRTPNKEKSSTLEQSDPPPVTQTDSKPKARAQATKNPNDPDPSYHPIIEVTDYVMGPGGEHRVKVKFKDGDELWLPVAALNETAHRKFLDYNPKPRPIPRLLRDMS